eukprot:TRINITY_DN7242_c0_g1_i1.p1 TRINITY_DN7242_c0_g1~~TRINITY_DN7242_c0_g1_i1.p1  ORF type:complete len:171 (-),score=49.05 TRINITY_DN7242_c0_g1_i1:10-522(-)
MEDIVITRATKCEREYVGEFYFTDYLKITVNNQEELEFQKGNLSADFPVLCDEKVWNQSDVFVAKRGKEVVGAIGMYPDKESPSESIWINFLSVDESCRGTGLGKKLMDVAFELSKEKRVKKLKIITLQDRMRPAFEWYLRLGFSVDKVVPCGPFYHDTHMSYPISSISV